MPGGNGATHAGSGGQFLSSSSVDKTYGSVNKPTDFGSGTGTARGGGIIRLFATKDMRIDGLVNADGASVGGSGGSIELSTGVFTGKGTASAKGGNGAASSGNMNVLIG